MGYFISSILIDFECFQQHLNSSADQLEPAEEQIQSSCCQEPQPLIQTAERLTSVLL